MVSVVQEDDDLIRVRTPFSVDLGYAVDQKSILDHWPNVAGMVRDCLGGERTLELWLESPADLQGLIGFMSCRGDGEKEDLFIERNYLPVDGRCVRGMLAANYVGDERILSRLSRLLADRMAGLDADELKRITTSSPAVAPPN